MFYDYMQSNIHHVMHSASVFCQYVDDFTPDLVQLGAEIKLSGTIWCRFGAEFGAAYFLMMHVDSLILWFAGHV